MREIKLTNSDKIVFVDDSDYEQVSAFTWAMTPQGYPRRNIYLGRINGKPKWKKLYLHRFIMNPDKGLRVDHINHNTLDCRRSNLRSVACAINNLNRQVPKNHPTGVNGVRLTKSGKFAVSMSFGNKTKSFGRYRTLEEAKEVRINLEKDRYASGMVG